MTKFFNTQKLATLVLTIVCLAFIVRISDALFLGNIIGCNSINCRLSSLESDVNQLKQQVARISGGGVNNMNTGINSFRPNGMSNQGQFNQGQMGSNTGQLPNQQQGQMQNQQGSATNQQAEGTNNRVTYSNLAPDYDPANQQPLRRVPNYQQLSNQFFRA